MSVLQRLTLAGFRCFPPGNPQQVQFDQHLTLIWGKAGSGKTTLVEVIRFLVIGAFPPMGDKGRNFVTDPAILKQAKVVGEAQLRFSLRGGQPATATRQVALTLGAKGGKFESIRQAISWKMDGQTVEEEYERGKMDEQIVGLMGISRTAADYVLFCHEEDSLWPFQGGAALTNIFEELLTTSRYSRIAELYRKEAAEKRKQASDAKKGLEYLKRLYDDDNRKKLKALRDTEQIVEEVKKMKNKLSDLTPVNMPKTIKEQIMMNNTRKQKIRQNIQEMKINMRKMQDQDSSSTVANSKIAQMKENYDASLKKLREIDDTLVSLKEELNESEKMVAQKDAIIHKIDLKMDLAVKEMHVPVHTEYIDKCLNISILDSIARDLEAYSNAIDASKIAFRRDKIAVVNRHLEDHWSEVYLGGDIPYIWVQTNYEENEKLQGYCLMMEKGGQKMEMRGRCSGEQKCLASILLRLSLAEVCSPPSRIIVLDQPGKGLSQDHICRLGRQLARMMERDFQIILISQDLQFLKMLEKLASPSIYQLGQDKKEGSTLRKRQMVQGSDV